jgi:hypothetical protein
MKRVLTIVLLAAFIFWILPLGFFIKPSQEKIACDGQRAICMCHVMIKSHASDKNVSSGLSLKMTSSLNKENSSVGAYYLSCKSTPVLQLKRISFFHPQAFSYQNPFFDLIDAVPKI